DQIPLPAADFGRREDVDARVTLQLRARFVARRTGDRAGIAWHQHPRHRVLQLAFEVHASELARPGDRKLAAGHPLPVVDLDPVALDAVDGDVVKAFVDRADWFAVWPVVNRSGAADDLPEGEALQFFLVHSQRADVRLGIQSHFVQQHLVFDSEQPGGATRSDRSTEAIRAGGAIR